MQMSTTTYHVIACIDGRLDIVGDTADPTETVGQVVDRASAGRPYRAVDLGGPGGVEEGEPPECFVHHSPMVWVGRDGRFWSCHKRNPNRSRRTYRPSPRLCRTATSD